MEENRNLEIELDLICRNCHHRWVEKIRPEKFNEIVINCPKCGSTTYKGEASK